MSIVLFSRQLEGKRQGDGWSTKKKVGLGILVIFIILIGVAVLSPSSRRGKPVAIQEFTFLKTDDGNYKYLLVLIDDEQREVSCSGMLNITIKDESGNALYTVEKEIKSDDFKEYRRVLTGAKVFGYSRIIDNSEVEEGSSSTGNVNVLLKTGEDKKLRASEEVYSLPLAPPEITVEYNVKVKHSSAYMEVRVAGSERDYSIHLSDPENNTVGSSYIIRDDMADGSESVDLSMSESMENPKSGQYILTVSYSDEIIYRVTPTYEGPEVSIQSAEIKGSYYDYLNSGDIDEINLVVSNSGDLPVIADKMLVTIDSEESEVTIWDEIIPLGGETEISVTTFITDIAKGVHPVTLELYSGGSKLASYDTQVEIG